MLVLSLLAIHHHHTWKFSNLIQLHLRNRQNWGSKLWQRKYQPYWRKIFRWLLRTSTPSQAHYQNQLRGLCFGSGILHTLLFKSLWLQRKKRAIKRERENIKTPNNLCEEYLHWLFTASLGSNICYLRGPVTAPCFHSPLVPSSTFSFSS